jgi:hypothetical protein
MSDEIMDSEEEYCEEVARIFLSGIKPNSSDEQLALHLMHRFNIDRDTIEAMPAFEDHVKPLFSLEKEE